MWLMSKLIIISLNVLKSFACLSRFCLARAWKMAQDWAGVLLSCSQSKSISQKASVFLTRVALPGLSMSAMIYSQ